MGSRTILDNEPISKQRRVNDYKSPKSTKSPEPPESPKVPLKSLESTESLKVAPEKDAIMAGQCATPEYIFDIVLKLRLRCLKKGSEREQILIISRMLTKRISIQIPLTG